MSAITKESLPKTSDSPKMLWDKYRWYLANWITEGEAEKNQGGSPMSYEKWLREGGIEPQKTIRLEQVRYGETFAINGWTLTVLDHVAGGVLCIDRPDVQGPYWAHEAFDGGFSNNLAAADIIESLEDYAGHIKDEGREYEDALMPMFVPLKDTAGVRNYGLYECEAGLLTLEQYGKYSRLIPKIDDPWWLATPYKAVDKHGPVGMWGASVWYVDSVGSIRNCVCTEKLVVRPTVTLKPDTLVTLVKDVQVEQPESGQDEKEAQWASYLKYLDYWREKHAGTEHYGKDPWCFEEWLDTMKAGDQYHEPEDGTEEPQGDEKPKEDDDKDLWHDCYLAYVNNWLRDHVANGGTGESPATYEKWLEILATGPAKDGAE